MKDINLVAVDNIEALKANPYPGRGIIIGMSPDAKHLVQLYWIMGRSENSRNRIFVNENGFIKTEAFDPSKVKDPSLIIYYAAKHLDDCHIVTNGDQTDTIFNALNSGDSFEDALYTRSFEPDGPNFTPRISSLVDLKCKKHIYKLSILKTFAGNPECCVRQFYNYEKAIPGYGHCIHTYRGDGEPLPSFDREPYITPVFDDIDRMVEFYWDALNKDNRISIFAKYINLSTKEFETRIINKMK